MRLLGGVLPHGGRDRSPRLFRRRGDDAKLARRMAAMSDSCDRFMDDLAPVAWTAEYLFEDDA